MAREGGNGDMTLDLGAAAERSPTRSPALQAFLLLNPADMDNPAARRLEVMLGFFGPMTQVHGIQSMENGKITNFFARK
ncbi:hypothetical protein V8E55_004951 [Tylopilus felleus]